MIHFLGATCRKTRPANRSLCWFMLHFRLAEIQTKTMEEKMDRKETTWHGAMD